MSVGSGRPAGRWISVFIRTGGILMGSNVLQAGISFASQLLLMRLLVPEDFGSFSLLLVEIGLIQTILSPRLGLLAMRARDADLTEPYRLRLYSAMTIEAALSLGLIALWLVVEGTASLWGGVLAVTLVANHWFGSIAMFYERDFPYRRLVTIETGSLLIGHAAAVAVALAGGGVASLYLREAVSVLLRGLGLAWSGAIPWRWPRRVTLAEWRALLTEARGVWLDGIIDGCFPRLTLMAAGALGGTHGAGLFSQAQRLALVPHQVLSPLVVRLAGNVFSRIEQRGDRRRTMGQILMLLALPLTVAAGLTWLYAPPIVPWLFGPDWRPAGDVLAALSGMVLGFSLFELARSYCLVGRLTGILGLGRLVQYGVLGLGCWLIADGGTVVQLAGVMSLVFLAATATVLLALALARPTKEE